MARKVTFATLFSSLTPLKKFTGWLTIVAVLITVVECLGLVVPMLFGKVIDELTLQTPSLETVGLYVAGVVGVLFFANILTIVREAIDLFKLDYKIPLALQSISFTSLFGYPIGQMTSKGSGLKTSVFFKGENAITDCIRRTYYEFLPLAIRLFAAVIALSFLQPIFGVLTASIVVIYIVCTYLFTKRFYTLLQANNAQWDDVANTRNELIRHSGMIKLFAKEHDVLKEYLDSYAQLSTVSEKLWWRSYMQTYYLSLGVIFIGNVTTICLAIYFFFQGSFTVGLLITIYFWITNAFENIHTLPWVLRAYIHDVVLIHAYNALLSTPKWMKDERGGKEFQKFQKAITVDQVSFSYPDKEGKPRAKKSLENISFTIKKGQKVAFVGHSGSGKSTLVQLLLHAYEPTGGSITVDGVLLSKLNMESFRRKVGVVEQHVELFDNTLEYNVLFGIPESEREAARSRLPLVAKISRIDQFFHRLNENPWETRVGEKGTKLSGGEKQRVGIARALIKNPDIIIFDEATSNLDTDNEYHIHEAMHEALTGRTGIFIAHRMSTIQDADVIVVFEKGRIVGTGTHDTLMLQCPQYKILVDNQTL